MQISYATAIQHKRAGDSRKKSPAGLAQSLIVSPGIMDDFA
jgi:hypothetical protein